VSWGLVLAGAAVYSCASPQRKLQRIMGHFIFLKKPAYYFRL
jgi:hypothetical protein